MTAAANNPLADRLAELSITPAELAALVRRSPAEVEGWLQAKAGALPDDAKVLTRFLADDADALRRVNHLRRTHRGNMQGAGINYAGITAVPYGGGHTGQTGGRPQ